MTEIPPGKGQCGGGGGARGLGSGDIFMLKLCNLCDQVYGPKLIYRGGLTIFVA